MNQHSPDAELVNMEPQQPLVAVVILNWNGQKFLEQFLPYVIASTYPNLQIIVADNASSDSSVAFVRKQFPEVDIIENSSNVGFARGYNSALKKIDAEYYVLLNSDVEVTPGWIEPIIHLMEGDKKIAACQPKVLSYHEKNKFEYAGACGGWIDNLGYPFARGRVLYFCENDDGQYNEPSACFWASGAALFVNAAIYHNTGGLDEYFFAHQEEIDFCWRLQLNGYKVFCEPASVVYHVGGGSLHKTSSRKTYLNFRNNLIMLYKNMPWSELTWKLPIRVCLDFVAAFKHLAGGEGTHFAAIIKAWVQFIKWILQHKRKPVFASKGHQQKFGKYKGSIIWDYYIKKKKRFSEIVSNK